jgi:uncharacterized protein
LLSRCAHHAREERQGWRYSGKLVGTPRELWLGRGMSTEIVPLRDRLRAAVPAAMKARDRRTTSALRSALAAIDNAEAVEIRDVRAGAIEMSPVGLGAAEVARRELTEAEVAAIVRGEVEERRAAAAAYEAAGRGDKAAELTAEADALTAHLG